MGNKQSRMRTNRNNRCCSQKNLLSIQLQSFRNAYRSKNNELQRLQKSYNELQLEYDLIKKTQRGSSGKHKDKANKLFNSLKDQYIDRLDRIKTQQHLLSRQTSILNQKTDEINRQKKELNDHNRELHTRKRLMVYNEQDDRYKEKIINTLKATLLISSIVLIILLAKRN